MSILIFLSIIHRYLCIYDWFPRVILEIWLGHIPLFLCILIIFVEIYTFEKATSFPSLYGLVFYRGRSLSVSLTRDWGELLKSFWGMHILWACSCNFPVRVICWLFFLLNLESLIPSGRWYYRFSGSPAGYRTLICFHWPLSAFWVRWRRNQSLGKPVKSQNLGCTYHSCLLL